MGYVYKNLWCTWDDWNGLISWIFGIIQIFFVIYCQLFIVLIPSYGFSFQGIIKICLFMFIALSALISDLKCALINPGTVLHPHHIKKTSIDLCEKEGIAICKKCLIRKPIRAHHCSKCHTCIIKMDHHCPWVNNCVGVLNQKYFVQFILYVFIGESYAFFSGISSLYSFYIFLKSHHLIYMIRHTISLPYYSFHYKQFQYIKKYIYFYTTDYPITSYLILFLECILSLLFTLFVIMMFFDQLRNMQFDLTLIEQKKSKKELKDPKSLYDCFTLTFGDPPCWRWFFPIEGTNTQHYYKELCNQFPDSIPIRDDDLFFSSENQEIELSIDPIHFNLCPFYKSKNE